MSNDSIYISDDDLFETTGFKTKSKQIEVLRAKGIPFLVNGTGHPKVTKAAIIGRQEVNQEKPWHPDAVATA